MDVLVDMVRMMIDVADSQFLVNLKTDSAYIEITDYADWSKIKFSLGKKNAMFKWLSSYYRKGNFMVSLLVKKSDGTRIKIKSKTFCPFMYTYEILSSLNGELNLVRRDKSERGMGRMIYNMN